MIGDFMEYKEIMDLPYETKNNSVFKLLLESLTEKDIENGAKPVCYASMNLIEWAIRNKKYEEYYSYIKKFEKDEEKIIAQEKLSEDMIVIVRFNLCAEPLFGFYVEEDGESAICYPSNEGMMIKYL
jgi:hypothetical protein